MGHRRTSRTTCLTGHDLWMSGGASSLRGRMSPWLESRGCHGAVRERSLGDGTGVPPALRASGRAGATRGSGSASCSSRRSVVAGARLLAAADDTVQVWAAAADLGAGTARRPPTTWSPQRVRFADDDALAGYFTVDDELPADLELTRSVGGRRAAAPRRGRYAGTRPAWSSCRRRRARAGPAAASRPARWSTSTSSRRRRRRRRRRPRQPPPDGPALTGVTVVDAPGWRVVRHQRPAPARARRARGATRRRSSRLLAGYDAPASPWSAADDERRPPARGRRGLGVRRARRCSSGRRDLVVLKRCVDVDDLLATAAAGQADVAVVGARRARARPRRRRPPPQARRPRRSRSLPATGLDAGRCAPPGSGSATRRRRRRARRPAGRRHRRPTEPARRRRAPDARHDADREPSGRVVAVWGRPAPPAAPRSPPAWPPSSAAGAPDHAGRRRPLRRRASPSSSASLDEVSGLLAAARLAGGGQLEERFGSVQRGARPRSSAWSPGCRGPTAGPRSGPAPSSTLARGRRASTATSWSTPASASRTTRPRVGRPGPQPADPGRARGRRRGGRGRQRRPGRAVPAGPRAGRAPRARAR